MRCPACETEFDLTARMYVKAPFGRFSCPSCGARVVLRHRWTYWAWIIGLFLGEIPIMVASLLLTRSLWAVPVTLGVLLPVFWIIDWQIEASTSRLELLERSQ
ncbi:MAG: hypothetical protein Q7W51_06045 [Coriobacteriia bacterium]|nr:hypothetical protein [Coriobacteriia bacterium]